MLSERSKPWSVLMGKGPQSPPHRQAPASRVSQSCCSWSHVIPQNARQELGKQDGLLRFHDSKEINLEKGKRTAQSGQDESDPDSTENLGSPAFASSQPEGTEQGFETALRPKAELTLGTSHAEAGRREPFYSFQANAAPGLAGTTSSSQHGRGKQDAFGRARRTRSRPANPLR